jgi:hypothetical protein
LKGSQYGSSPNRDVGVKNRHLGFKGQVLVRRTASEVDGVVHS